MNHGISMEYNIAANILNRHIFDGDKIALLENIADYPERFMGLFRPTKPKAKILQNLLQSHEIRFGDAIEELLEALIQDLGYSLLPSYLQNSSGETLSLDQYFLLGNTVYFVEQKVRDDHDSTKKRGQIRNFESKLEILIKEHGSNLTGIMYFVDPSLKKNRKYYHQELRKMSEFYGLQLHLFYGVELFKYLGHPQVWDNLIDWLDRWKAELPDLPEVNLDLDPSDSFDEIKNIPLRYWRKLILNDRYWDEGIIQVLFKEGATLRLLLVYFGQQKERPYQVLKEVLDSRLVGFYPSQS